MFRRGSTLWFIAHDLRVTWRTWFQRRPLRAAKPKRRRFTVPVPIVVVVVLLIGSLAAGIPVGLGLRDTDLVATPLVAFIIDAALLLVFTLMLSQTLVAAVDAFYDRGDLDLLLSSPIPPTRILIMRAVAMALNPALLFGGLVTPFVVPIAILGHPQILAVYVIVASIALLSTGRRPRHRHRPLLRHWSAPHAHRGSGPCRHRRRRLRHRRADPQHHGRW